MNELIKELIKQAEENGQVMEDGSIQLSGCYGIGGFGRREDEVIHG